MKVTEEKVLKIKLKGGDVDKFKKLMTKISQRKIGFGVANFTAEDITFIDEKIKPKFK